ncbi:PLP-dependent aminotransferase family protein [Photobacterium sagamiensis]|uniref:aminotransferase-like domain-containing protein n=1 Tax=Photobacterium sagamiensis TaxID=2910241 RepID=UPI003D0EC261
MSVSKKYQEVEAYITQRIEKGSYQPGDKLPSIRALSDKLQVSKNTVIRAYLELEASQLITPQPRSGYTVTSPPDALPLVTSEPIYVDLMSLSKSILIQPLEPHLMPAGSAHPDTDFPAIRSLYAEIGRHSRYQTNIPSHYQLPPGNETLIKQLVHINQELGIITSPQEILITHGAQQAISLSLQALTQSGDIVLVDSPCYFGTLLLLESLGLKALEVPAHSVTGIDLLALEKAVEQWPVKAILINPSYNNPTGHLLSEPARKALLKITSGIPIIEDDVFGGLSYQKRPQTLKALDNEDRVIYCNSLSKTLDSRLRIGWVLAGKYQQQIEKRLMSDNMGSLNLMQSAVGDFLKTGKYRQHLSKIRRSYRTNQREFYTQLTQALDSYPCLKGNYHLSQPEGSFLCWLTLPDNADGFAIYQQAEEAGVSLLPGGMFSTQDQYNHCIRLSFATFRANKKWQEGIKVLAEIIANQLKPDN